MIRLTFIFTVSLISGCVSEPRKIEGVTFGAGDAIAANTAMQVVDPWMRGVDDPVLIVPAHRGTSNSEPASSARADRTRAGSPE